MRPHPSLTLTLAILAAGCTGTMAERAAYHLEPGIDPDGGVEAVDEDAGVVTGPARPEVCGNGLDDDDDGMIDEGCGCALGESRPCWLGPPASRGVGACHDGTQDCLPGEGEFGTWGACVGEVAITREVVDNGEDDDCDGVTDEPDGVCLPVATSEAEGDGCSNHRDDDCDTLRDCDDPDCVGAEGCPDVCHPSESVCYGGHDDDCDGAVDCDDAECFGDPSCSTGPCAGGETPTYRQRRLPSSPGASSIRAGDGTPIMPMSCDEMRCAAGLVAVETDAGTFACVPPPEECPAGTNPTYVGSGAWRCEAPCEIIIHYGSIYGGQTICTGRPHLSCSGGQVPTFVFESREWACRTPCNNGLYDRRTFEGLLICVPC